MREAIARGGLERIPLAIKNGKQPDDENAADKTLFSASERREDKIIVRDLERGK